MKLTPGQIDQAISKYKPPTPSKVQPVADTDISARLSKLESLKTQELISEAEYTERRQAILNEI